MNRFLGWEINRVSIIERTKSLGDLGFGIIDCKIAKKIIIENHYSKKWNHQFGIYNIAIFKNNEIKGVASFGRLMNPQSFKSIINSDDINSLLELNRLWISDEIGKNAETLLISMSFQWIKNNHREVKAIQSFADGRLGCGTIYKASNFKYYGYTESLFFEDIKTKECFHKIPLENTKRPNGFVKLNIKLINKEIVPFKVKTYRYIYILDKHFKIKLNELPYPTYDIGFEYCEYRPTINQLMKVIYIMKSKKLDYSIIEDYVIGNFSKKEIDESYHKTIKYFTA